MESPSSTRRRRPCFIEEDDGLVSLNNNQNHNNYNSNNNKNIIRPVYYTVSSRRSNSLRNLSYFSSSSSSSSSSASSSSSSLVSPRSVVTAAKYYDGGRFDEPQQHFLDACALCKTRLAVNSDIFMYRGDTPFCSEECRQQQIEMDEAKEKKRNISSIKAMRKKDKRQSTSPDKASPLRPGTVAAA